jgi:hypothetical protein
MASSMPGAMPQIGERISFQTKPTMTKERIVGDEDGGAVEGGAAEAGRGEERGQHHADRVLHEHVDHEEPGVVAQRVPEALGPARVGEEGAEVVEADELPDALGGAEEREVQGREERDDHDRGVDEHGRCEEHEDVPAERLAVGRGLGGRVVAGGGLRPGGSVVNHCCQILKAGWLYPDISEA